jgi:chloride channel protein, CIC family
MSTETSSPLSANFGLGSTEIKRRRILPKAIWVGLAAGLIGSAFRLALGFTEMHRIDWLLRQPPLRGLIASLTFGILGGGLSLWLVRKFCPEASGSGIPNIKAILLGAPMPNWKRLLPIKFIAGVVGIGSGLALGREGPTVQMGGASSLLVSAWYRVKPGEGERRALMSAGAGAGLAAAFNAPLAGVMFVLEELHGAFSPIIFIAAFIACVVSSIVAQQLAGSMPVFHLLPMAAPGERVLLPSLLLGALAGFAGVGFNRCLLLTLDWFDSFPKKVRNWLPGMLVGCLIGGCAWLYPLLSGGGGRLADQALADQVAVSALPLLILARFALTMFSYGTGTAGGIFAPLLVIGALGGLLLGHGVHAILPFCAPHPEIFAVLGMGAFFTAIVRSPLTGIVLMVEMTGQYGFMLPLLTSCLAAYGVAEWLGNTPIYEALRLRTEQRSVSTSGAA